MLWDNGAFQFQDFCRMTGHISEIQKTFGLKAHRMTVYHGTGSGKCVHGGEGAWIEKPENIYKMVQS